MYPIFLSHLNKKFWILSFFFSQISLAAAPLWKAGPLNLKDLGSLGFLESTETLSSVRQLLILKDIENGHALRTVYSPFGEVELLEESTLSGKILERQDFRHPGAQLVVENFEPTHRTLSFRSLPSQILEVEVIENTERGLRRWNYRLPLDQALSRCESSSGIPLTPPAVEKILANLSWLFFQPATTELNSKKTVDLGNHLVAENCAQFPNGGIQSLTQASTEGIRRGVYCLRELGPSGKMLAAKLISFFQPKAAKKAKIQCTHSGETLGPKGHEIVVKKHFSAHAFDHDSPEFPGLYLNLDDESFAEEPEFAAGVIFHEMIHWLGYAHGSGIDISYLAESCCFTNSEVTLEKNAQTEACNLLKDHPSFTSEDYHRRFARVMKSRGLPTIPLKAAWMASQSPQRDSSPLMASVLSSANEDLNYWGKRAREKGDFLSHLVLGKAALQNLPEKLRSIRKEEFQKSIARLYSPQDIQSKVSDHLGTAMNAILNRNEKQFVAAWTHFRQIRKEACSSLNQREKDQLQKTLNFASVELFDVKPSIASYSSEFNQPCP